MENCVFSQVKFGSRCSQMLKDVNFWRTFHLTLVGQKKRQIQLFGDLKEIEPGCEKTGLRGFRAGPTQTRLYSHRRWLEA